MLCTTNCKNVGVATVPSICCKNKGIDSSTDGNTIKKRVATNSIANIPSAFMMNVVLTYFIQRPAVIPFAIGWSFNFICNVSMLNHTYSTSETLSSSIKNIIFVSLYGIVPVNTELTIVTTIKNTKNFHILKLRTFELVNLSPLYLIIPLLYLYIITFITENGYCCSASHVL